MLKRQTDMVQSSDTVLISEGSVNTTPVELKYVSYISYVSYTSAIS